MDGRLGPISEKADGHGQGGSGAHPSASPESPCTPVDVDSGRPAYSPNIHNAASCLFLFPVRPRALASVPPFRFALGNDQPSMHRVILRNLNA